MERTGPLDDLLEEENFDGFLMRGDSSDPDMYYLAGFEASDPFIYLRTGGKSILLVPQLEFSRAKEDSDVDEVISTSEFVDGEGRGEGGRADMIAGFLERYGIQRLAVPEDFPLGLTEELSGKMDIEPVENRVMEARKLKTESEVEKLEEAQSVTEEAMQEMERILGEAKSRNGELYLEDEPLTSERARRKLQVFLLEHDCTTPEGMIVACGEDGAKPHSLGSGVFEGGKPVVVDIFPRHGNRYFGDMTRTFVKGEPGEKTENMHNAVKKAKEAALKEIEAGVKAAEVHSAVCDVLEEHGFDTMRSGAEEGFIHSTGHAVGLGLHEPPRIADSDTELEAGNVLTIEPGLYYGDTGGVRIEDMVLVTENGYENFNSMHEDLRV
ncbi:MAG: M24 family metallopeptidase [Candidatus Nanohaloarchaea archaeon]